MNAKRRITKGQIILILLSIFHGHFAGAQVKAKNATANVSIVLDNILSIGEGVNTPTGSDQVDFVFDDVQKYQGAQSKTILDQINVLSTTSYSVAVMSEDMAFSGQNVSGTLDGSILTIQAKPHNSTPQMAPQQISPMPIQLYEDSKPTSSRSYDFTYIIDPQKGELFSKEKGKYKRTIRLMLMAR